MVKPKVKTIRFHPERDKALLEWVEAQDNLNDSIHRMIKDRMDEYGLIDYFDGQNLKIKQLQAQLGQTPQTPITTQNQAKVETNNKPNHESTKITEAKPAKHAVTNPVQQNTNSQNDDGINLAGIKL